MTTAKLCRNLLTHTIVIMALISWLAFPAFCVDADDSQIFISGFNAYQQKDYKNTIAKMNEVLQKYPDTPLRDMSLFWLARAHFKNGSKRDAARTMAQFTKEYPDSPLKNTVEEELLNLSARYARGEKITNETAAKASAVALRNDDSARAEKERIATAKAEEQRRIAAKAEQERIAALKAEEQRQTAIKAEEARLAAVKAAEEQAAAAKVDEQRRAAAKAEQDRIAALQAKDERIAARKAEDQRLAAIKAEEARLATAKAAEENTAAARADKQRRAAAKAKQDRIAAIQAEEARIAAQKDKEEELQRVAAEKQASEKSAKKAALREKAIAQYKSIIQNYPDSKAAQSAAAKLQEMGITVAIPAKTEPKPEENAQVFRLEVAQFAAFEFRLTPSARAYEVGQRVLIPFEITNRGNGNDAFHLESGFPAIFNASFAAATNPNQPINQTASLTPGETFRGVVALIIPAASIDGLRITHPVKAASSITSEASQSREVNLVAAAPLLRAVIKANKPDLLPGEKVTYRVAILNVGSTAAQDINFKLNFPPQLEPVDYAAAGFRQELKSALVMDGMGLKSGESREFNITFQLKDDSLAGQELLCHAELNNKRLKTTAAFVSNVVNVKPQHGLLVRSANEQIVVVPGQTVNIPFVITNNGNIREKINVTNITKGTSAIVVFHDLNRDGIRQAGEPEVKEIGPLEPKEEAHIVAEVKTLRSAADNSAGNVQISFSSAAAPAGIAQASTRLIYSRPVLQLALTGRDSRLKPGDIASFDLDITNRGSNLARIVDLQSSWPEQLELIAAEPANSAASNGKIFWNFKELGAGEKRTIKVSFRVKPGIGVGTSVRVTNILKYEDQQGNRY